MDLRESPGDSAFRSEVAGFIAENLPESVRLKQDGAQLSTREETLTWQSILYERGWGAPHWAKEHGGTGWTPQQRLIFDIECAFAGAPWVNQQGMNLLGPIVNAFGTQEQRRRLVSPIVRGEAYWCQGFSEPNAGSDLAAIKTSARKSGDRYYVNGQKIWTSHAEHSDWIFLLVRTSKHPRKQLGISFLVSPIDAPGITVRPIPSIDGLQHLAEVFLDEVEVPEHNLIGEEGKGWTIAKHLLGKERVFGACDLSGMLRELGRLKALLGRQHGEGLGLSDDLLAACRLARLDMQAEVLTMSFLRAISEDKSASRDSVTMSSILKVGVTELHQEIVDFMYEALGDRGPLFYPRQYDAETGLLLDDITPDLSKVSSEAMYRRASSIYGGTNEIQRGIVARIAFGF